MRRSLSTISRLAVALVVSSGCGSSGEVTMGPVASTTSTNASAPSSTVGTVTPTEPPTTTTAPPPTPPPSIAPPPTAPPPPAPPTPERLPALQWASDLNGEPWVAFEFDSASGPGRVTWTHLMRPYSAEGTFTGPVNGRITMVLRYSDFSGMDEEVGPPETRTADIVGNTLVVHEPDGDSEYHPD